MTIQRTARAIRSRFQLDLGDRGLGGLGLASLGTARRAWPRAGRRGVRLRSGGHRTWCKKPVSGKSLKLSDDQIARLKEMGEPQRRPEGASAEERQKKRMEAAQAREKKLAEILEPAQLKRLKEIGLQSLGPRAFSIPRLVADLNLTEEQQDKIRKIVEESAFDLGKMMRSGELEEGDSDEIKAANKAKIAKVNDAAMEKIVAQLAHLPSNKPNGKKCWASRSKANSSSAAVSAADAAAMIRDAVIKVAVIKTQWLMRLPRFCGAQRVD